MLGTAFAFPRITWSMEILIVLFILALTEKNPELKDSLQKVLKFYRENRELLTVFASSSEPSPTQQNSFEKEAAADFAPEKLRIIEEYLKRQ